MVRVMRINSPGIEIVKRFEGFRGKAYLCPAGILTIGYGHTSMAGPPPVKAGQTMTRAEAAKVLARDLEGFSEGVRAALKRDLTDNQFSALVSFAYNVGLGAFRSSSVLKAVNAGDFESVPRRLQLWVKAGARVLPGLAKRRAAEAHLFMTAEGITLVPAMLPAVSPAEIEAMDEARGLVEPLAGTEWNKSTTIWGAIVASVAGAFGYVKDAVYQVREITDYVPLPPKWAAAIIGAVVLIAAAGWIISERVAKSRDDAI